MTEDDPDTPKAIPPNTTSPKDTASGIPKDDPQWKPPRRSLRGISNAKNRRDVTLERAPKVCEMYLQGVPQKEIARKLKMDLETIKSILDSAREQWVERCNQSLVSLTAEQLARIDQVSMAAWDGYRKSMADLREVITKEGETDKGFTSQKIKKRARRVPSAEFLKVALECIRDKNKLLGIGKENEDKDANPLKAMLVVVRTPDEANAILNYDQYAKIVDEAGAVDVPNSERFDDIPIFTPDTITVEEQGEGTE